MVEITGAYRGGVIANPQSLGDLDWRIEDEKLQNIMFDLYCSRRKVFGPCPDIDPSKFTMDVPTLAETVLGNWKNFKNFTRFMGQYVDKDDIQSEMVLNILNACDDYYDCVPLGNWFPKFPAANGFVVKKEGFKIPKRFISKACIHGDIPKNSSSTYTVLVGDAWGINFNIRKSLLRREPHPTILIPNNRYCWGRLMNSHQREIKFKMKRVLVEVESET